MQSVRNNLVKSLTPCDREVEQLVERKAELIRNFLPNTTIEQINAIVRIRAQEPEAKPPPWQRSRYREDSLIAELVGEVISQ